jgi:hypothetical protein
MLATVVFAKKNCKLNRPHGHGKFPDDCMHAMHVACSRQLGMHVRSEPTLRSQPRWLDQIIEQQNCTVRTQSLAPESKFQTPTDRCMVSDFRS